MSNSFQNARFNSRGDSETRLTSLSRHVVYRQCLCCLAVPTISRQYQSIPEVELNLNGTVIRFTSVWD